MVVCDLYAYFNIINTKCKHWPFVTMLMSKARSLGPRSDWCLTPCIRINTLFKTRLNLELYKSSQICLSGKTHKSLFITETLLSKESSMYSFKSLMDS